MKVEYAAHHHLLSLTLSIIQPQCLVRFQEMAYLMLCHYVAPPDCLRLLVTSPAFPTIIRLAQERPITASPLWRQLFLLNNPPEPVLGVIRANAPALLDEMMGRYHSLSVKTRKDVLKTVAVIYFISRLSPETHPHAVQDSPTFAAFFKACVAEMKDSSIAKITHWLENVSGVVCDDWATSFQL